MPLVAPPLIARRDFAHSRPLAIALLCFFSVCTCSAQIYSTLASFGAPGGYLPEHTSLAQGRDGAIYGTVTTGGATTTNGMVFKITPSGAFTDLYNFCVQQLPCGDGAGPNGLILGTDGDFYGTTSAGGAYNAGTIFKITPAGKLTTLYSFCAEGFPCPNGANSFSALVQGADDTLYGVTFYGGVNLPTCGGNGCGTIFKFTRSGTFSKLYSFCSQSGCTDGALPEAALAVDLDQNLYGAAEYAGVNDGGTLFRITPAGQYNVLHSFCAGGSPCSDGASPFAGLILGLGGEMFGTTIDGGLYPGAGTVFKITPGGKLTTLYDLCPQGDPCPDGYAPFMGLARSADGNLYGSTTWGAALYGTLFELTPKGVFTTLHIFSSTEGYSNSALLQSTTGKFFGTTLIAGQNASGTIFSLDMGLRPFVTFVRRWGKASQTAQILGQGFRGTTAVSFGGVPAEFKVISDTFLIATVPATARTGLVTVHTPSGRLVSNVPFQIVH